MNYEKTEELVDKCKKHIPPVISMDKITYFMRQNMVEAMKSLSKKDLEKIKKLIQEQNKEAQS